MNRIVVSLFAVAVSLVGAQSAWAIGPNHGPIFGGALGKTKVAAMRGLETYQFPGTKFRPATFTKTAPKTWSAQAVSKLPPGLHAMPIIIQATVVKVGTGPTAYKASPTP